MPNTTELCHDTAQCCRLGELLPRWFERVPLYQGPEYSLEGEDDDAQPCAAFRKLPLITKAEIKRDFPANFLPAGTDLDSLVEQNLVELEHTSGTSEARVPLLLPRGWWNEQEEKALWLNSLVASVLAEFPNPRRCTISSPVCNGDICYSSTPAKFDRIVGQALNLSLNRQPLLWTDADLARMAAEAVDWNPQFLDLDPVYGVRFAQYCERRSIQLPSLRFIICSYEFLSVVHRRILERVFGVPVFNLYGSTETGHLLMENHRGQMVASTETACLEMLETAEAGISRLIVTTLTNDYMPLIRYRIGDLVERRESPAGSHYILHGREADAFLTPRGRRVTTRQFDQCFAGLAGFAHYQIIQTAETGWSLRYVQDGSGPGADHLAELRRRCQQLLGVEGGVEIQSADFLLPEASGKFRLTYPLPGSK